MGGSPKVHETDAQKALAQHAADVWGDYKIRWLPVQQNLASQIEGEGARNSPQRAEATGKASTDSAIQFGQAQGALQKALTNSGAAPGSGRFDSSTSGLNIDEAKSSGLNKVMSDQAVDDAYTKGLGALTQIGLGNAANASAGLENQARSSAAQAQADAQAALEDRMAIGGAVGTTIGLAGQQKWGGTGTPAGVGGGG